VLPNQFEPSGALPGMDRGEPSLARGY
jgi:hypothetical protein